MVSDLSGSPPHLEIILYVNFHCSLLKTNSSSSTNAYYLYLRTFILILPVYDYIV